jgi:hypothetical protein
MKLRWKILWFCSLPKHLMHWHTGSVRYPLHWHTSSVRYPFYRMFITFCAPCNLGIQILYSHDIKPFDKNHVLHQLLKLKEEEGGKKKNKLKMWDLFKNFSHLVNYWKMLVCMYICMFFFLDLEPCLDEVFGIVTASSAMLKGLSYVSQNPQLLPCYVGGQLL